MLTEQTTQLQTGLRGKLIQPEDADYDISRKFIMACSTNVPQ